MSGVYRVVLAAMAPYLGAMGAFALVRSYVPMGRWDLAGNPPPLRGGRAEVAGLFFLTLSALFLFFALP